MTAIDRLRRFRVRRMAGIGATQRSMNAKNCPHLRHSLLRTTIGNLNYRNVANRCWAAFKSAVSKPSTKVSNIG